MQQNQWERLRAQLAWHDLSSFCFCLRISCYIFSFISSTDIYWLHVLGTRDVIMNKTGKILFPVEFQLVKNPPAMRKTLVQSLGWKDPLEKGRATHSSILAWKISWTEEPSQLQSMESRRVGYNWVTFITFLHIPVYTDTNINWTFTICKEIYRCIRMVPILKEFIMYWKLSMW